jgi:Zn-dependent M28 family amino/carboxypeptidase
MPTCCSYFRFRCFARYLGLIAALAATRASAQAPELLAQIKRDVQMLAGEIGARGTFDPPRLRQAADFIASEFSRAGHSVRRLPFIAGGARVENLEVEVRGASAPDEIVVIGAHYDTVPTTPGADDNASGVAVLLSLARAFASGEALARTVRFVAFANEEPAYFQTELMGSRVYAKACRARGDRIVAMISLDSLGYYSDKEGSQRVPDPALRKRFPSTGNFLAFVSNERSAPLLTQSARAFREATSLRCEMAALPADLPGVGWSDHWAFWQEGYPAFMVTGTAPYRNPHYHRASDTPTTLDFSRLAQAATGLAGVTRSLAQGDR